MTFAALDHDRGTRLWVFSDPDNISQRGLGELAPNALCGNIDEGTLCVFSATASFVSSGVLATVGVATLRHLREPRALLFAAVPMLFAVHQLCEGVVWLGLEGGIGTIALDHMAFLFTLYAQGVLPLLMPLAVLLMEPPGWRRRAILALTIIGAVACAWDVAGLIAYPTHTFAECYSIAYRNPLTGNFVISCFYIFATCGALLLSTHRVVRWYGLLNVVGLTIVHIVKGYAFASVWCFYAAILSVIIYWQFRRGSIDVNTPNGTSPEPRPFIFGWLRRNARRLEVGLVNHNRPGLH